MSKINESIFREYDIRGIVENDLSDDVVERIAKAVATVFIKRGKKSISIGYDGRPHSPRIKDIFIRGLLDSGLDVTEIGLVPTPVLYYSIYRLKLDGGVSITASHNPPEYNGFKVVIGRDALSGKEIKEIYNIAVNEDFLSSGKGKFEKVDIIDDYLDYINDNIKLNKKIKVVVDAGNGTGGITAKPLYERLGAEVIDIFCDVDGTFPNHHPDPTKVENLKDLIKKVKETGSDLGLGFDGDADRVGVVDDKGNIVWSDLIMIIFARDLLKKNPGAKIISEVKASEVFYSEVRKAGGVPIMWKTGHSLIKKKIYEENALLAGEVSGHIFFNDKWFGFDDAIYAGARLLEILSNSDMKLSEIMKSVPNVVNTPEIRIDVNEEIKFKIVDKVIEYFKKDYDVIDIDGARIKFADGWALVRASNTQPSLVLRFEANSEKELERIKSIVNPILDKFKKELES